MLGFLLQDGVGAVEVGVGFGEGAMLGLEVFELLLEVLDVFFFALAKGALGGAVLGSAALRDVLGLFGCHRVRLVILDLQCACWTRILYLES